MLQKKLMLVWYMILEQKLFGPHIKAPTVMMVHLRIIRKDGLLTHMKAILRLWSFIMEEPYKMWTVQVRDLPQCNHIQKTLHLLVVMPYLMVGKVQVKQSHRIGMRGIHQNLVTRLTWLCIKLRMWILLSKRKMQQLQRH